MDGRMEDGYKCVFSDDLCPVRREFKLKPENLLGFCRICPTQKPSAEAYMPEIVANIPEMLARVMDQFFKEREMLQRERLELVQMLVGEPRSKLIKARILKVPKAFYDKAMENFKVWDADASGSCGWCGTPIAKGEKYCYILGQTTHLYHLVPE